MKAARSKSGCYIVTWAEVIAQRGDIRQSARNRGRAVARSERILTCLVRFNSLSCALTLTAGEAARGMRRRRGAVGLLKGSGFRPWREMTNGVPVQRCGAGRQEGSK